MFDALVPQLHQAVLRAADENRDGVKVAAESVLFSEAALVSSPVLRERRAAGRTALEEQHFETYEASLAIVEQALRIAALLHDVGHMPFSHDFEHALELWHAQGRAPASVIALLEPEEPTGGADKPHERLGIGIVELLRHTVENDATNAQATPLIQPVRFTFKLAATILDSPTTGGIINDIDRAESWLHRLVAGEVEVDRCDYVLRDGQRHGFEFVNYDLARLIENLDIIEIERGDHAMAWEPAIREHGLSALESFLVARMRLYQYAIRHHKVAQIGAVLQRVVVDLLESGDPEVEEFLAVCARLADGSADGTDLDRFAELDDVWCLERIRRLATSDLTSALTERRKSFHSMWKRTSDFPDQNGWPGSTLSALTEWNADLPRPKTNPDRIKEWEELVEGLWNDEEILVVRHMFKPWRRIDVEDESEAELNLTEGDDQRPISMDRRSAMIHSLWPQWYANVQVQAFCKRDVGQAGYDEKVSAVCNALPT